MNKRNLAQILVIILSGVYVGSCARTAVRPETEILNFGLPRPQEIIVYSFAVTEAELTANQGPIKNETSRASEGEGEREPGMQAANALAEELVRGLRELGFTVERRPRGTPIESDEVLIDGAFLDVDKGNRLERLVIGFGAGASKVDTEVHVYYGVARRKLIDFRTHADSGKMPGAAATMGAGAVVVGGVTAGSVVASAASGAVKEYHSEIERMAAHSADQAVAYLSEFFVKQGWIRPDQVKRPTVDR